MFVRLIQPQSRRIPDADTEATVRRRFRSETEQKEEQSLTFGGAEDPDEPSDQSRKSCQKKGFDPMLYHPLLRNYSFEGFILLK